MPREHQLYHQREMSQPRYQQSISLEARILLALQALNQGQFLSSRAAAAAYNVSKSTLNTRRAGVASRRDIAPNSMKLTKLEEEVIVKAILDLDLRGYPPTYLRVRGQANLLLTARGGGEVGINWPANFVRRRPELATRYNRRLDYQRALCENRDTITAWFKLVENIKAKYGIQDTDTWNFDETGFMMGVISSSSKVVTGSERRYKPKQIQPGNREWVSSIIGVGRLGQIIPPFIIFQGKVHQSS
jgi:hypothetical protein